MVRLQSRDGGEFDAYVSEPRTPIGAGLVVLQEIFGINASIRATADAWAEHGYRVIAPDLFWRQEPGVALDPGREADRARAMQLMQGMDQAKAVEDALVAAAWLGLSKIGVVGYCLGGKLAYLLSMEPGVDAAVSYYGVGIQGALDRAAAVRAPLLLHLAAEDHLCPPAAQTQLHATLEPRGVEIRVHHGVGHAFARLGGATYDADAARHADDATLRLFTMELGR